MFFTYTPAVSFNDLFDEQPCHSARGCPPKDAQSENPFESMLENLILGPSRPRPRHSAPKRQRQNQTQAQPQIRIQKRTTPPTPRKNFKPNFNVYETSSEFVLEGEFPGVCDKEDINIEFDDEQRLVLHGNISERKQEEVKSTARVPVASSSSPSQEKEKVREVREGELEPTAEKNENNKRTLSPTVEDAPEDDEDEEDYTIIRTPSRSSTTSSATIEEQASTSTIPEPQKETETEVEMKDATPIAQEKEEAQEPPRKMKKVLLKERTEIVGSFERTFKFASPVDVDGVRAGLGNGLLRIVVPKTVWRNRKIEVL